MFVLKLIQWLYSDSFVSPRWTVVTGEESQLFKECDYFRYDPFFYVSPGKHTIHLLCVWPHISVIWGTDTAPANTQ